MLRKNEVAEEHVTNRAGTNFLTINPDREKCKFMDFFLFALYLSLCQMVEDTILPVQGNLGHSHVFSFGGI